MVKVGWLIMTIKDKCYIGIPSGKDTPLFTRIQIPETSCKPNNGGGKKGNLKEAKLIGMECPAFPLVLEEFQTVFLVQVPAPELFVVLGIGEIPVYDRGTVGCERLRGAD